VLALVNKRLPQRFLDVLDILLINDLSENSQRVRLEHVVLSLLNIFLEAGNDDEHFVFADFQLFDEDVDEPPQISIKLVPLALWNLEKLGNVEEKLTFLVFCENLALI